MGRTTRSAGDGASAGARQRGGARGGVGLALLAAVLLPPAAAGAAPAAPAAPRACPESVLDRYEPGDEVTVVGYTAGCLAPGDDPGPPPAVVSGYLHADPCTDVDLPYCTPSDGPPDPTDGTPVGRFALTAPTDPARGRRMELTFTLPAGTATGLYYLVACQDPCAPGAPEDLAATPIYVGVDPPPGARPVRHWPLDDPAIAALPDDALVQIGDGRTLTGAEVRASGDAADPTDLVTSGPDAAADRPGSAGEGWQPPGWAPAATLVLTVVALAAWWGRGRNRKRVVLADRRT